MPTSLWQHSQVASRLHRDGTGGGSTSATRQFTFDVMGRVATDGPAANQQSFTSDDRGLLRTSTGQTSAGASSFSYDSVGRMMARTDGAGTASFGYTDRGEMNGYTINPTGDQSSTVSLAWNPFGQVSQINYPAGATRTLAYDGAGRLNDDQTSVGGATYTYDSLDRVIGRSVSGATKFFNYAGFETDPTSDGTSSWSRSPGGSVLGQTRVGTSVLVGTERHGDVAWTLNPTTGTIADSTVSDPYGKALSVTGTPGQIGFQGDWTDPLTGLVWMAARWYDTQTGTFTSRATYPGSVGAALTLNRYLYASGSPLLYSDPTGHYGVEEVSADYFYNSYLSNPNTEEGINVSSVAGWSSGGNYFSWGSQGNDVGNGVSDPAPVCWIDGNSNTVVGNANTVTGNGNEIYGSSNTVVGSYNEISGNSFSNPYGNNNVVVGNYNDVAASGNVVVGSFNTEVRGSNNFVSGSFNKLKDSSHNVLVGSGVTLRDIHDGVFIGVKSGTVLNGPDGIHAFLNGLKNIDTTFGCFGLAGQFDSKCDKVRSSFLKGFLGGIGGIAKQVGGITACAVKVVGEASGGCVLKVLGSTATGILTIPKSVLESFDEGTKSATACVGVAGNVSANIATAYVLSKVFEGVKGSKSCNSFTPEPWF